MPSLTVARRKERARQTERGGEIETEREGDRKRERGRYCSNCNLLPGSLLAVCVCESAGCSRVQGLGPLLLPLEPWPASWGSAPPPSWSDPGRSTHTTHAIQTFSHIQMKLKFIPKYLYQHTHTNQTDTNTH